MISLTDSPIESNEKTDNLILISAVMSREVMERTKVAICTTVPGTTAPMRTFASSAHNIIYRAAATVYEGLQDCAGLGMQHRQLMVDEIKNCAETHGFGATAASEAVVLIDSVLGLPQANVQECHAFTEPGKLRPWLEPRMQSMVAQMSAPSLADKSLDSAEFKARMQWVDEAVADACCLAPDTTDIDQADELIPMPANLPPIIANLIDEAVKYTPTQPEYVLANCLAAVQIAASGTVCASSMMPDNELDKYDAIRGGIPALGDWLVCGDSSTGKSNASKIVCKALREWGHMDPKQTAECNTALKAAKLKLERAEAALKKNPDDEGGLRLRDAVTRATLELNETMPVPSLLTNDITPERFVEDMRDSYSRSKMGVGAMWIHADEGKTAVARLLGDAYKASEDLKNLMLDCYNGAKAELKRANGRTITCPFGYANFFVSCTPLDFYKLVNDEASIADGILARTNLIKVIVTNEKTGSECEMARHGKRTTRHNARAWEERLTRIIEWRFDQDKPACGFLNVAQFNTVKRMDVAMKNHALANHDKWLSRGYQHIMGMIATLHALEKAGVRSDEMETVSDETFKAALSIVEWLLAHRVQIIAARVRIEDSSIDDAVLARYTKRSDHGRKRIKLSIITRNFKHAGKLLQSKQVEDSLIRMGKRIITCGRSKEVLA